MNSKVVELRIVIFGQKKTNHALQRYTWCNHFYLKTNQSCLYNLVIDKFVKFGQAVSAKIFRGHELAMMQDDFLIKLYLESLVCHVFFLFFVFCFFCRREEMSSMQTSYLSRPMESYTQTCRGKMGAS